jgi:hypothetical protein
VRTPAGSSLHDAACVRACLPAAHGLPCYLGCLLPIRRPSASQSGRVLLQNHMPIITLCPAPLLAAVKVAGKAMEVNMTRLGPLVLPWSGARPGSGLTHQCTAV